MTPPTDQQTFHQFYDLVHDIELLCFTSSFHGAFATGVAYQQGTPTPPDTWFRLFWWDLLMLQLLRPVFPNLHQCMIFIPTLTFTKLREVCNGLGMPAWSAYPSRHHGQVWSPFMGLAYALIVETSFPELVVSFVEFSP